MFHLGKAGLDSSGRDFAGGLLLGKVLLFPTTDEKYLLQLYRTKLDVSNSNVKYDVT